MWFKTTLSIPRINLNAHVQFPTKVTTLWQWTSELKLTFSTENSKNTLLTLKKHMSQILFTAELPILCLSRACSAILLTAQSLLWHFWVLIKYTSWPQVFSRLGPHLAQWSFEFTCFTIFHFVVLFCMHAQFDLIYHWSLHFYTVNFQLLSLFWCR